LLDRLATSSEWTATCDGQYATLSTEPRAEGRCGFWLLEELVT
jgi:hypothetical protein